MSRQKEMKILFHKNLDRLRRLEGKFIPVIISLDRARVAQFFRMLRLVRTVEQWLNDIFSSKTIVRNKRDIFHRSMGNQLPSPAKKNDDGSKGERKTFCCGEI